MAADEPRVNVIIANYNYGLWVQKAIQSALDQDYKNLMITIVDDNSTDDSRDKIEEILGCKFVDGKINTTINAIQIIAFALPDTNGPSNARNIAIHNTLQICDIYAILDADDEMMPNKVSRCVAEMLQQNLIGVVYADYIIEDLSTGFTHYEYKEPYSKNRLLQECIVHSGAVILKKCLLDVADQFGYYDVQMRTCEDYDLWMRISEKYMIVHVAEPLTLVRIHKNNSTNTVDNKVWRQNWQRIADKTRSRNGQ